MSGRAFIVCLLVIGGVAAFVYGSNPDDFVPTQAFTVQEAKAKIPAERPIGPVCRTTIHTNRVRISNCKYFGVKYRLRVDDTGFAMHRYPLTQRPRGSQYLDYEVVGKMKNIMDMCSYVLTSPDLGVSGLRVLDIPGRPRRLVMVIKPSVDLAWVDDIVRMSARKL